MKLILAIIKPFKLHEVKDALSAAGIQGMTVTEARGFGRQKGHREANPGQEYTVDFLPRVRIELALPEALVARAVAIVRQSAQTGKIGDGKLFVLPLEEAIRVRTGERGDDAL